MPARRQDDPTGAPSPPRRRGGSGQGRLPRALAVALLVPWLVGSSLMVMLLPPVTGFWASRLADFEHSAVSPEELLAAADAGVRYVAGGADRMPRGDSERTAFSSQAIAHMQDVRAVLGAARLATLALSLALMVLAALLLWRGQAARLGRALQAGGLLSLCAVAGLAVAGWLSFDSLFTWMHGLLFADGTWTFSADSLLITAYPSGFWMAMAATWAGLLAIFCLMALTAGRRLSRHAAKG